MIHRLDDKNIYVGNQGIKEVLLGDKTIFKVRGAFREKPDFSLIPKNPDIYHYDFGDPDFENKLVTFDPSLGQYVTDGFKYNYGESTLNTVTYNSTLLPKGIGVYYEVNISLPKDSRGRKRIFRGNIIGDLDIEIFANYPNRELEIQRKYKVSGTSLSSETVRLPWPETSFLNILMSGMHSSSLNAAYSLINGVNVGEDSGGYGTGTTGYNRFRFWLNESAQSSTETDTDVDVVLYEFNTYIGGGYTGYVKNASEKPLIEGTYNRALGHYN